LNPLNVDESGNLVNGTNNGVWSGTTNAGTAASVTCMNWTSNTFPDTAEFGLFDAGPGYWSDAAGEFPCSNTSQVHLYCFDTSRTHALTIPAVTGRVAFISKGDFDPSTGVSTADTLCQTEATNASLTNPTSFLALISTSTVSAASRFDMTMGSLPFIRPDGIKIADAPTLAMGTINSGIWQYADGSYFTNPGGNQLTWTGSTAPNAMGTLAQTCADWSSKSTMTSGIAGAAFNVESTWWNGGLQSSCAFPRGVYCLEQ
jgi:hypothetical protein